MLRAEDGNQHILLHAIFFGKKSQNIQSKVWVYLISNPYFYESIRYD